MSVYNINKCFILLLLITTVLFAYTSCQYSVFPVCDQEIVIDGMIQEGEHPVVIVTSTVPASSEFVDYTELEKYILHWAKVTVYGPSGEEVVLTGQKSNSHFPPYIYTTMKMIGRAGEKYSLKVEYGKTSAVAETFIPKSVPLVGLRSEAVEGNAGKSKIIATLRDDPKEKNYYMFFVKVEYKDSTFVPSFMGLIDDEILDDSDKDIVVYRGIKLTANDFDLYYDSGDVVKVKLVSMDEISYRYWSDYQDLSTFSRNPFFPSSVKIRSNVQGGLGLWAGYGAEEYTVLIP